MEEIIVISVLIAVMLAFVAAFYFFIKSAYHFVLMLQNVKSKRHDMAMNLAPYLFAFSPNFYTTDGQKHLSKFKKHFFHAVLAFLVIVISFTIMEMMK